jgi:hypothetical protein
MSKYQIITNEGFKCTHCGAIEAVKLPISIPKFTEQGRLFNAAHKRCTELATARKRYRLHTKCRKAGLAVDARKRQITEFDETELPAPAQKLLNEFQYNFQHTL